MDQTALAGRILTPAGWVAGTLRCTAQILGDRARARRRTTGSSCPASSTCTSMAATAPTAWTAPTRSGAWRASTPPTARPRCSRPRSPRLPTICAARWPASARPCAQPGPGARVLGAHLEGPFISPDALGAQPPFAIPPDLPLLEELAALAPIRVATYAPEIDPDGALLAAFRRLGIRAQIGHTTCSYAQARAALAAGAAGFTHLYNAMSGMHHRRAGAVGAALALGQSAELILDFQHVDEGAALRGPPGAAAAPLRHRRRRRRRHARRRVSPRHAPHHQAGDTVRLADGSLAGSVLTMDRALRNLLSLGLPLAEAARRCSTLPAEYLGLPDRGRLVPAAAADLVVVDGAGQIKLVLAEGAIVGRPARP